MKGNNCFRLIAEISPGKKGGDFELPFGGQISIQPGTLNKRDVVTCCMVTPSDRFKYQPSLRYVLTLLTPTNVIDPSDIVCAYSAKYSFQILPPPHMTNYRLPLGYWHSLEYQIQATSHILALLIMPNTSSDTATPHNNNASHLRFWL